MLLQTNIKTTLKQVFGYDEFRPLQEKVVENVVARKDTLAIMPTGSGKSLCYQIPALIFEGLTIVVSPLISLMKDQVEQLQELGIGAVVLNSSLSYHEYRKNIDLIKTGKAKFLYLAPETLLKENILELLKQIRIDCMAIDEAHCISEWGHDFRPEYRILVKVREDFPTATCIALTATATPRVQQDIKRNLKFADSNTFVSSFDRDNLFLQVADKENSLEQTVSFLKQFPDQSGIIYCFSREQVNKLAQELEHQGFSVKPYHAGLSEKERARNQEFFIKDDVQIIVATIAFGMGINKPNVRFVIHHDLPKNIEGYYQEIGRAGRDSLQANCLLLFSYADIAKIKYFINKKQGQEKIVANSQLSALVAMLSSGECRRNLLLAYFGEKYEQENCGMCDNCTSDVGEKEDLTIPAQKFLSCVKRTGEIYGIVHIIDVLRGSKSKKVIGAGHDKLSTYGIGMDYSKKDWSYIAQQLINTGLMKQDLQYGSLKLTEKSYDIFQGKIDFYAYFTKREDSVKTKKQQFTQDYDLELFELLRKKRKQIADSVNMPPYIIFSDKTLVEMCIYFPQTPESLLNISGVGKHKMEKYGQCFLDIIRDYAADKGLEEQKKIMSVVKSKTKKYMIIGTEFTKGLTVAELSKKFNIKSRTVLDNLFKYVKAGETLDKENLLRSSSLSSKDQQAVLEAFKDKGIEYLKPIFDFFNGRINYEELSILRLYFLQ